MEPPFCFYYFYFSPRGSRDWLGFLFPRRREFGKRKPMLSEPSAADEAPRHREDGGRMYGWIDGWMDGCATARAGLWLFCGRVFTKHVSQGFVCASRILSSIRHVRGRSRERIYSIRKLQWLSSADMKNAIAISLITN